MVQFSKVCKGRFVIKMEWNRITTFCNLQLKTFLRAYLLAEDVVCVDVSASAESAAGYSRETSEADLKS